jgi:hypothetical protein
VLGKKAELLCDLWAVAGVQLHRGVYVQQRAIRRVFGQQPRVREGTQHLLELLSHAVLALRRADRLRRQRLQLAPFVPGTRISLRPASARAVFSTTSAKLSFGFKSLRRAVVVSVGLTRGVAVRLAAFFADFFTDGFDLDDRFVGAELVLERRVAADLGFFLIDTPVLPRLYVSATI